MPPVLLNKKLDALYIQQHFPICLLVYFCLCFSMLRILEDVTGSPRSLGESYGVPLVFTMVVGFFMRRWAAKTIKELGLKEL